MPDTTSLTASPAIAEVADNARRTWSATADPERRSEFGQFFTPPDVARLMAEMFPHRRTVRLLDPGAGVGALSAAYVDAALRRERRPAEIRIVAYETDSILVPALSATLAACRSACERAGVSFGFEIRDVDFVVAATQRRNSGSCRDRNSDEQFDAVIANPPYRKIRSGSGTWETLRRAGVETSNLYAAFVELSASLLRDGGDLVAITPRSFCNGPYFRSFRRRFFADMTIVRAHVFDRRDAAFREDQVLQENMIFRAVRRRTKPRRIVVSSSDGPGAGRTSVRHFEPHELLDPADSDQILRLPTEPGDRHVAFVVARLPHRLEDLGVEVSTGRVVDFRSTSHLLPQPVVGAAPLIYPESFSDGVIRWPPWSPRKPCAIAIHPDTERLLNPRGTYVLVKRFTSKEEPRRVVAALCEPAFMPDAGVAFENHVNYLHRSGGGLPSPLARGLVAYLNSGLVDAWLRQSSGNTQVNAHDLRRLRVPARAVLDALGRTLESCSPGNPAIDRELTRLVRA